VDRQPESTECESPEQQQKERARAVLRKRNQLIEKRQLADQKAISEPKNTVHLEVLSTSPSHRRKGVAKALIDAMTEQGREMTVVCAYEWTVSLPSLCEPS